MYSLRISSAIATTCALVALLCAFVGCGDSSGKQDGADDLRHRDALEANLRTQFAKDGPQQNASGGIWLTHVSCAVAAKPRNFRCIYTTSDGQDDGMTVIVNPSGTSWSTPDSPQAKSAQAVQFTSEGGPPGTEGTDPVYAWGQVTCADFRANKKWLPKAAEIEGADMASNQSAVRESVFIKSWARVLTKLCHDSKNPAYEPSGDALDAVVADLTKRGY